MSNSCSAYFILLSGILWQSTATAAREEHSFHTAPLSVEQALRTSEDALAAARRCLGERCTVQSMSASLVSSLEPEWFFANQVDAKNAAWRVEVRGLVIPLGGAEDTTAPTLGPLDMTLCLRAKDGTLLGMRSPWKSLEEDDFGVLEHSSEKYAAELEREGEAWVAPAPASSNLQQVLREICRQSGCRLMKAEQLIVHCVERTHNPDPAKKAASSVAWSIEARAHSKNAHLGGAREAMEPSMSVSPEQRENFRKWWNSPEHVRARKVSVMRYVVSDFPLKLQRGGNTPFPNVIEREVPDRQPGDQAENK